MPIAVALPRTPTFGVTHSASQEGDQIILKKFPIARFLVLAFSLLLLAGCPGSDHFESDASFERPQRPDRPLPVPKEKLLIRCLLNYRPLCRVLLPEAIGQIVARETTVLGPGKELAQVGLSALTSSRQTVIVFLET